MYSLLRSMGSSVGISVVETLFSRYSQTAWNQLGGFLQPYNPALSQYLNPLHLSPNTPLGAEILQRELINQSQMLSFVNVYAFIASSFLCMLPLLFFLKKQSPNS